MKHIILVLLVFFVLITKGQKMILLGYTLQEMRKEMPDEEFVYSKTVNGNTLVESTSDFGIFYYTFDANGVCSHVSYYILSEEIRNEQANKYNTEYEIISPFHWRRKINGVNVDITIDHFAGESKNVYSFEYK